MWNARLKPVLENDGSVIVSDEEGFNNISDSNHLTWASRLDLTAANAIILMHAGVKLILNFSQNFLNLSQKYRYLGM